MKNVYLILVLWSRVTNDCDNYKCDVALKQQFNQEDDNIEELQFYNVVC